MKKFITSVLSALATAVCSTAIVSNAAFNPNKDPNGDGVLGIADAVYISQYLCGLFEPTDLSQLDVDDNDIVSIVDQIYMQMYEAGSITSRFGENESPDTITRTQTSRQYNVYNAVTTLYLRNYTLYVNDSDNTGGTRNIIGIDDRVPATGDIGTVEIITGYYNHNIATGFVVGNHTIATAAHVVYDGSGYTEYMRTITIENANGVQTELTPVEIHIPADYNSNNTNYKEYDYALISVEEDLSNYKSFKIGAVTDNADDDQISMYTVGFPGDHNYLNDHFHKYLSTGNISFCNGNTIRYTADTVGGNSGGPVYVSETLNGNTYHTVVGIHTDQFDSTCNQGIRINAPVLKFLIGNSNILY